MDSALLLFALLVIVLGVYVFMLARNGAGVVAFAVLLAWAALVVINLLGFPAPRLLLYRHMSARPAILGIEMDEPHYIYLWLQFGDQKAPRAFRIPWSESAASQLENAESKARAGHGSVHMHVHPRPGDPMFYPVPQKPLPPKTPYQ